MRSQKDNCKLAQAHTYAVENSTQLDLRTHHLEVFCHKPRLKCREQERCCNTTQNASNHQNFVLGRMFGNAAQYICDTVSDTCSLSAPAITLQISYNRENIAK